MNTKKEIKDFEAVAEFTIPKRMFFEFLEELEEEENIKIDREGEKELFRRYFENIAEEVRERAEELIFDELEDMFGDEWRLWVDDMLGDIYDSGEIKFIEIEDEEE